MKEQKILQNKLEEQNSKQPKYGSLEWEDSVWEDAAYRGTLPEQLNQPSSKTDQK